MVLQRLQKALALILGAFVLYTAATGPFEGLIQRASFLALVSALGVALYPLGAGTPWRPVGVAVDLALTAVTVAACGYVVVNYDEIMTTLPWATSLDMALTAGLVLAVLELGRRTVGVIFPLLVVLGLVYAYFGDYFPGLLHHRGFGIAFMTETIFLGDLGIWGMLTGIAATVIAAFVLFGALLLHTGGGQTFIDLAMRLGGRQPGGAAKIATIASGLFGMISGSSVANVATTGNFTIPMMIRLGYARPFAAAVEAVASTGGQLAPPIMGAAAFVMAEILSIPYTTVMMAAVVPALLFYVSVFVTIHFVAIRRDLPLVPEEDLPAWGTILAPRNIAPVLLAFVGLGLGIWLGRSVATSAFYGIVGLLGAVVLTQAGTEAPLALVKKVLDGLEDAGRGVVVIGVLLAGAQILVSMINLTGVGVTLSSLIIDFAGQSAVIVALVVAMVCLIMGMGLPTTAAYVLVAAVLAPAMTSVGMAPLTAHLFVFYFATISAITPPVCVAVFVGAGIARTNWLPAGIESVRLGAVTYLVPFMLLLYPGMTLRGGGLAIADALLAGVIIVIAVPALLSGIALSGRRWLDVALFLGAIVLAVWPHPVTPVLALILLAAPLGWRRYCERSPA